METENRDWTEPLQLGVKSKKKDEIDIYPIFSNLTAHIEDFNNILKAVSNENFLDEFSKSFSGLHLDLNATLKDSIIQDKEKVTLNELFLAAATGQLGIYFTNGKIKYAKNNVDSIASIPLVQIKGNVIQVAVDGDAELAEETLKRIVIFFFEKASLVRNWPEIEKMIFCKNWRLGVEIDLKIPTLSLLHPELQKILKNDITGSIHNHGDMLFDKQCNIVQHEKRLVLDPEIKIGVKIIDQESGIVDNNTLEFDRSKTFHHGTGRMRVVANCDFDTLKSLLNNISRELR